MLYPQSGHTASHQSSSSSVEKFLQGSAVTQTVLGGLIPVVSINVTKLCKLFCGSLFRNAMWV